MTCPASCCVGPPAVLRGVISVPGNANDQPVNAVFNLDEVVEAFGPHVLLVPESLSIENNPNLTYAFTGLSAELNDEHHRALIPKGPQVTGQEISDLFSEVNSLICGLEFSPSLGLKLETRAFNANPGVQNAKVRLRVRRKDPPKRGPGARPRPGAGVAPRAPRPVPPLPEGKAKALAWAKEIIRRWKSGDPAVTTATVQLAYEICITAAERAGDANGAERLREEFRAGRDPAPRPKPGVAGGGKPVSSPPPRAGTQPPVVVSPPSSGVRAGLPAQPLSPEEREKLKADAKKRLDEIREHWSLFVEGQAGQRFVRAAGVEEGVPSTQHQQELLGQHAAVRAQLRAILRRLAINFFSIVELGQIAAGEAGAGQKPTVALVKAVFSSIRDELLAKWKKTEITSSEYSFLLILLNQSEKVLLDYLVRAG